MRWRPAVVLGAGLALGLAGAISCADDTTLSVADAGEGDGPTVDGAALDTPRVRRPGPLRVLFFTKETLFFHTDAHKIGDEAVPKYLRSRGDEVVVTNDPAMFNPVALADFDVTLFFVTSGVVFDAPQRAAFEAFIRAGGGFAGVHAASATESDSPFFRRLVGATFWGHGVGDGGFSTSSLDVVDASDPLVSFLPNPWVRRDEWYYFIDDPGKNAALTQLLRIDESTLPPSYPEAGTTGIHPLAWKQTYMGGRSFYTALGHIGASYEDELFLRSIALGVEWAGAVDTH
jgi:type 1 glutamine amidotransferase